MASSIFFLTTLEEKVFLALSDELNSVTSIAISAKVPRTSAFKALQKLEALGLTKSKKVRLKNQHAYTRVSDGELLEKLELIKKKVLRRKEKIASIKIDHDSLVSVYTGKEVVVERLRIMMSQDRGGRIYTLQASGTTKEWINAIGEEAVLGIHTLFKEKELIVVGIQGEAYSHHIKKYTKKVVDSFKERLDDLHIIPDEFLEQKTALYIYKSVILFVDIEKYQVLEVHSHTLSKVLKKMLLFMSLKSPRVRGMYDK